VDFLHREIDTTGTIVALILNLVLKEEKNGVEE